MCSEPGEKQSGSLAKFFLVIIAAGTISVFAILLQSCLTPSILVTREQGRADVLFNNNNYREAIDHYQKTLEASRKLGIYRNLAAEGEVCRKIADSWVMLGNYDLAMTSLGRAFSLDSTDNNLSGKIDDLVRQGSVWVFMGSYFNGIRSFERSLELSEGMDQSLKNTRKVSIAGTYLALGQLYAIMGRSSEARGLIQKALAIYRQSGERKGEMEALLVSAGIYSDQADNENAVRETEESLKQALQLKLGTARHNQLLASVASSKGEYEKAIRYQEKAIEEARRTGIMAQIIWTTIGMGDIYRDLGDVERAQKYYNIARHTRDTVPMKAGSLDASIGMRTGDVLAANRYFKAEGSLSGKAVSDLRMAGIMLSNGSHDSARYYLGQAEKSFSGSGNLQGLANVKILEGKLYLMTDRPKLAEAPLDSAISATGFPETLWQAWYNKGIMFEKLHDTTKAIDAYRRSVIVIEKIRGSLTIDELKSTFFDSKREVYDRLINLLVSSKDNTDAFTLSEQARSRAFYDILANKKIDFRRSLSGDLITVEQDKRLEMQKLYTLLGNRESGQGRGDAGAEDTRQIKDALAKVQDEYADVLRRIKLNNPSYAEMVSAEPVSIEKLQSHLGKTSALLEYWLSNNNIIIWLITGNDIKCKSVPVIQAELTSLVENTRKAIQSNRQSESDRGLRSLYDKLILPFEKEISGFSDLVIIPNGSLHFLPFQALQDNNGEYFVEKHNVIYAPSSGVYIVCKDRPVSKGSNLMGFALADMELEGRQSLPGTDDELKRISLLFPERLALKGKEGTESMVKNNASRYNFIHFATHGSYNFKQPLYSYLLFPPGENEDGHLNVYEVFEMNINAKLVTLSACETGLGNLSGGDELTGLSRAFLFAGSSSVVVSLWAVADHPTSLLMSFFYKYMKDHPVQEALSMAQRDVLKLYPQPLYWSSFVLIGNGEIHAD
ncbi:MAG: CHAT domain-containing protein [Bacteroidales bacterium]